MSVRALTVLVSMLMVSTTSLAQSRNIQLAQINSYVAEINRFIKRNPKQRLIVTNVAPYDSEKPQWRKFKTEAEDEKAGEFYESADVWSREGKVVAVDLTLSSPSGDWAQ